jgi:hypothetical protein
MHRDLALRVTVVVIAALAFNCGGGSSSPTEPARRDSLVLLSAEPAQGAHVEFGKRVPVRARFRYTFKEPAGGKIGVLVYPLPFNLPILTDPLPAQLTVEGQEGEATLLFDIMLDDPDIQIPKTIVVSCALFPQGQTTSPAVVEIRYEVDP